MPDALDALDALEAATAGPDAIVRKSAGSAGSGRRAASAGVAARATTDVRAVAVSLTPPIYSAVEAAVAKVAGRATAVAIAISVAVATATALGRTTAVVAVVAAAAGRPCGALEALRQDESHNCSDYAMQKMRHTEQHQL